AVMAHSARLSTLVVNRQGDAAVRAVEDMAALAAEDCGRETPPVQKQERLLASREALTDLGDEAPAEDDVGPVGRVLVPQVDDRDLGQRPVEHAAREHDLRVTARLRVERGLER